MASAFLKIAALLAAIAAMPSIAAAEPTVRVLSFTADWCPTCQVLDPRLARAINGAEPGNAELVKFDQSAAAIIRPPETRRAVYEAISARARAIKADEIWTIYETRTGFAVIIAADSGEMLGCVGLGLTETEIRDRVLFAAEFTRSSQPGSRNALWSDCPSPEAR